MTVSKSSATAVLVLAAAWSGAVLPGGNARGAEAPGPAEWIATRGGFPGGLCVVVGCGEAETAAALGRTGRFLVQVLDADAQRVEQTRQRLRDLGVYGLVSVDRLPPDGRLPYTEELANVVLVGRGQAAAALLAEARRVLCPRGALLTPADAKEALAAAGFVETEALGEGDSRWTLGRKPRPAEMGEWTHPRHGPDGNAVSADLLAGPPRRVRWVAGPSVEVSNVVSAAGRNYYGGVWARDAFNGLRLWDHALKPSPARGNFSYSVAAGAVAPVAAGERLLVVSEGKLIALDGASGRPVREYPEAGTPKQVLSVGALIVTADDRSVRAVEAESGKLRWTREAAEPQYAVAGGGAVFFLQGVARRGESLAAVALELAGGEVRWQRGQDEYPWLRLVRRTVAGQGLLVFEVSTLADEKAGNVVHVASDADGRILWSREFVPGMNHMKQARAMFADGLLWLLEHLKAVGLDPRTGEVKRSHPAGQCHCFPPVATERYMFSGEFDLTDLKTGRLDAHPITKAACGRDAGWVPANGLIYACPKHCVCWPMLRGYVALAPAHPKGELPEDLGGDHFPLERGAPAPDAPPGEAADAWPTYRADAWRSAATSAAVPADLDVLWTADLGARPEGPIAQDWSENPFVRGPLTAPVAAEGEVFVARPDAHEVVALDAATGAVRWRATACGRVDTPPTVHAGLCLFGTRTGWVYCLRADDGRLVWRLRAAPGVEQIVAYGQVESPWPVAGSVLVVDGVAFFAAGRQALADGGILVFAVDPPTGKVLWTGRVGEVPAMHFGGYGLKPGELPEKRLYSCNALEFDCVDLLHREDGSVAMSRWLFERATGKPAVKAAEAFAALGEPGQQAAVPRGAWTYAPRHQPRLGVDRPMRPLLAFRGAAVVGSLDDMQTLFRRDFDAAAVAQFNRTWITGWAQGENLRKKQGDVWRTDRVARGAAWQVPAWTETDRDNHVAALVLAGDKVFAAGSKGGLAVFSAADGSRLAARDLPPPIWDGMAAAGGRLFVSARDGRLVCLGSRQ